MQPLLPECRNILSDFRIRNMRDCRVHESDNMSYFSFIILELETSLLFVSVCVTNKTCWFQ